MRKSVNISVCILVLGICVTPAFSQEWTPKLTEKWEPVPAVVTPGQGTKPPSDAIVLFDGTDLAKWERVRGGPALWSVEDGAMTIAARSGDIRTKQSFGDIQLHVEWRTPSEVVGEGQGIGNSGVFLQERYEVQILDSFSSETYANGQAGSLYKQHIPLVNASRGPGEWQTFDIIYEAPVFSDSGTVILPAIVTVIHNGVLIQNRVQLSGPTLYIGQPEYEKHGKLPISLQDHGNPVSYRNIWVREL